jgi:ArsR family transcriptional regulator
MPEIASLQLFKLLSDETRLGIVLLLREGELCVCDLCTALEQSQPKTSVTWQCYGKVACCWIASRKWVHYRLSPYSFLGCSGD